MTVEVLLMCPSCGRPQPARKTCVHCGATLPSSPVPSTADAETQAPAAPRFDSPFVPHSEFDLGDGRRLRVDAEAVELVGTIAPAGNTLVRPVAGFLGSAPVRLPLKTLRRVALERRRAWVALAVVAAGIALAALATDWVARLSGAVLASVGVMLFVRVRTWIVRFERTSGADARLVLGGAGLAASSEPTAERAWAGLVEALRRHGVDVANEKPGSAG